MILDKHISFHIENQFPAIYREDGKELVQLIKEYYAFLESDTRQSIYNGRRIFDYRDIDSTLNRMLLFFKNKYLADLPFDDETTRFIVKNILALYRRKGTAEGLEVFFRLFYDESIRVYYPAEDILRPSNSQWKSGSYIEISPNDGFFTNPSSNKVYTYADVVGKKIIGEVSGASAIIDKINFIIMNNTILPIIFLDDLKSEFIKRENIISIIDGIPIKFGLIRGSAREIEIDVNFNDATIGNSVGDKITISSLTGVGLKGLVSGTTPLFTGIVDYKVLDGGWGYSIDTTRLIVSNQIFFYTDPSLNLIPNEPLEDQLGNSGNFIGSNLVSIGVKASASSEFVNGSIIKTTSRTPISSVFLTKEPNFSSIVTLPDAIRRTANNLEPEASLFNTIISGSRKLGDLNNNGSVTEQDAIEFERYLNGTQQNQTIIDFIEGEFNDFLLSNSNLYQIYPARKVNIFSIVAKNDSSPGDLFPDTLDPTDVIVSDLSNTETVSLIFDIIGDYLNVSIDAANYNDPPALQPMSGNTDPVNLSTPINQAFNLTPVEFGTIVGFNNIDPGSDYINDVFAIAEDSRMILFDRNPQAITLTSLPTTLNIGNTVFQNGIGAKVLDIISNTIVVRPYTYFGFNNVDPIAFGGSTFTISSISTLFISNELAGKNATIFSNTNFASGKITSIDITDSGYKYMDGKIANVLNESGNVIARGSVKTKGVGSGEGFWAFLNSHINGYIVNNENQLSYFDSGKKIQDSDFYQEYAYEISSKIDFSIYERPLKEVTHVAGTKAFGKFMLEDFNNVSIKASITIVA